MLSILIPAYNYNITQLVEELHKQSLNANIVFEIIVMEDGSTKFFEENKKVNELEYCKYIFLPKNIGRSAIRNKLADTAQYDYLLFLDCDSEVKNTHFIEKYITRAKNECVISGGRMYNKQEFSKNKSLVMTYGIQREQNTKTEVDKYRKKIFMSPNFLISKSLFKKVKFNEDIKGYGHEDSILGIEIERLGVSITYINNPIIHKGLENNKLYIQKNEMALRNLLILYNSKQYPELEKKSKVLKYFITVKKLHLNNTLSLLFKILKPFFLKQLNSLHPSLLLWDAYKLGYLTTI